MKFGPLFLMGRKINGIVIFVYSSKYCWDAVISNQDSLALCQPFYKNRYGMKQICGTDTDSSNRWSATIFYYYYF